MTSEIAPQQLIGEQVRLDAAFVHNVGAMATDGQVEMAPWLKNSEASQYLSSPYINGDANIHTAGYQDGYMVSALPTSLPVTNREHRVGNEQDRMTPWAEMSDDEKSLYVDLSEIAITHTAAIPFDLLRPKTKQTMLANRLFDINSKSQDPAEIRKATDRNSEHVSKNEILTSGQLIHATAAENIASILRTGLVAQELRDGATGTVLAPYNIHLARLKDVPPILDQAGYDVLLGQAASAYGNIGIVLDRSETSTDYGNEISAPTTAMGMLDHTLIFGGIPSTEIAALCTLPPDETLFINANGRGEHEAEQATLSVIDSVLAHGEYIPVLDTKGNLALTKEQFDERRAANDYGNFVKQEFQPSPDLIQTLSF